MTRNPVRSAQPPGTAAAGAGRYGVIGVAPGQTTTNVEFDPITLGGVNGYGAYDTSSCYSAPVSPSPPPPATVTPDVALSCPTGVLVVGSGAGAYDTQETCTATGTPSGGTFAWSLKGNAAAATIAANGSSATVTAAGQSGSSGDTDVYVSYGFNGESAAEFQPTTVRDPSGLTVVSDSGTQQDYNCLQNGLANYTSGDQRFIQYEVTDGLGVVNVAGIPLTEAFTPGTNTCNAAMHTRGGATLADGEFNAPDQLVMCSNACSSGACPPPGSCVLDETQRWYANGLLVKTNSLAYGCTTITWNGE
jgi:hypothetical protein